MKYERFFVSRIAEYADPCGGTFCEVVTGDYKDEEALRYFFTLYGCKVDGEAEALIDRENREDLIELEEILQTGVRILS